MVAGLPGNERTEPFPPREEEWDLTNTLLDVFFSQLSALFSSSKNLAYKIFLAEFLPKSCSKLNRQVNFRSVHWMEEKSRSRSKATLRARPPFLINYSHHAISRAAIRLVGKGRKERKDN